MSDDEQVDRIEAERQRREREFLLLLLLLSDEAERHAVAAVRLGHDPISAARNVWIGNPAIEQPGAAPLIAEQMAMVELAGINRARKLGRLTDPQLSDVTRFHPDQDAFAKAVTEHLPEARNVAALTWQIIERELRAVKYEPGIKQRVKNLRLAFDQAGVTKSHHDTLAIGIERQTVEKYNTGLWKGAIAPDLGHRLAGFRHVSVIDAGTTEICRERDGLTLPADDPYWRDNWCPLHYGCRSIVLPLFGGDVKISEAYPEHPPALGFGKAPAVIMGSYFGVTVTG